MDSYYICVKYKATKSNTFFDSNEKEVYDVERHYVLPNELLANDIDSDGKITNINLLKEYKLNYDVIKHSDHIHSTLIGYEIISVQVQPKFIKEQFVLNLQK